MCCNAAPSRGALDDGRLNFGALCVQLASQGSGGGECRVTGVARGKICQERSREPRWSAAGGDARNLQRGGGIFGAKTRISGKPLRDDIECFAVSLQSQQPIDVVLCEAGCVAGITPGNDAGAQPAVVLGGIAA